MKSFKALLVFGFLSALIGSNLVTVAAMPDLTRYVRSDRQAVVGVLAGGVEGVLVHEGQAEGAHELGEQVHGRLLEGAVRVLGQQRGDQVAADGGQHPRDDLLKV